LSHTIQSNTVVADVPVVLARYDVVRDLGHPPSIGKPSRNETQYSLGRQLNQIFAESCCRLNHPRQIQISVKIVLVDRFLAIDQYTAISFFESLYEKPVNIGVIAAMERNICALYGYTEISQSQNIATFRINFVGPSSKVPSLNVALVK
jgi:hypothetical protein